jgi:transposase
LNILGWTHWRILSVKEHEHDYQITAEQEAVNLCCPHCSSSRLYRHEIKHQLFMDIPIRGRRTGIQVVRKRYRCRDCNRTFFEPLNDMNEHHFMTKRLVLYIAQEALRKTFTSISYDVGIDEKLVRLIFRESVKRLDTITTFKSTCIGIDELYLLNQYRCIITDVEHHQIIDLLRDRHKPTVITYLQRLPDTTKEHITVVCTDMWASYHDAVHQVLPHSKLVVDKFHVLKLLSGCLETVRKQIRKSLTDKQRKTLMHDRFLLLRRPYDLDERETLILEAWLKNFPRLEIAYHLKEAFYGIYEASTKEDALQRYFTWFTQITPDVVDAFLPFTLTIEHYGDAIFNYFTDRYTAGYTECLNGIIKLTQRTGRGYSFDVLRTKMLQSGGLQRATRPGYGEYWATHATSPSVSGSVAKANEKGI